MDRMKGDPDFGTAVRFLRESREWTQQELADRAGCSKQHVWDLEHGRRSPSFRLACKFADALGVNSDALRDLKRAKAAANLAGI